MKNITTILTGVLLAGTFLFSFEKCEDDKVLPKNYLKIGETEYDLSAGILENYGTDSDDSLYYGFNTNLLLYSEGLSLQTSEYKVWSGEYEDWDLNGSGHLIYFEMFSTSGNALDNGDYIISSAKPLPIGTINASIYSINIDFENFDSGIKVPIISGQVSVSISGSEYNITINCTDENGENITGFYKGTLRYFDFD